MSGGVWSSYSHAAMKAKKLVDELALLEQAVEERFLQLVAQGSLEAELYRLAGEVRSLHDFSRDAVYYAELLRLLSLYAARVRTTLVRYGRVERFFSTVRTFLQGIRAVKRFLEALADLQ